MLYMDFSYLKCIAYILDGVVIVIRIWGSLKGTNEVPIETLRKWDFGVRASCLQSGHEICCNHCFAMIDVKTFTIHLGVGIY